MTVLITAPCIASETKTCDTVINNNSGTKLVSDFPLFVGSAAVTSGVATTLSPGNYSVSETNLDGYTASTWGGDCDATGKISLLDGNIKVCTISNDDNPVSGSGLVVSRIPPIISITKTPYPLALPNGPGLVTYSYIVSNIGQVSMRDIKVTDDKCLNPVFMSGDANNNSLLEINEAWIFRCTSQITQTTKNIATVIGYDYGGLSATDVTSATVIVGQSVAPPLIKVIKVPNPLSLSAAGGLVKYSYTVTNIGDVSLSDIKITDDKCRPLIFQSGDANQNSLLDLNEAWLYSCQVNILTNTVNTVTVQGRANGLTAIDYAITTVLVSDPQATTTLTIPKLPNTGLGGSNVFNIFRYILLFAGIIVFIFMIYMTSRKRFN